MRDRERESSILNIKWREWRQQQSGVSISGKLITVASLVDYQLEAGNIVTWVEKRGVESCCLGFVCSRAV